jgi:hypothetical protein
MQFAIVQQNNTKLAIVQQHYNKALFANEPPEIKAV